MNVKIKHITFDDYGGQIIVDGKTGPRRVRLVASLQHLNEWLNNHPDGRNSESLLWVKSNGKGIGYNRVHHILSRLGKVAGIKKRIHPHLFRHSRATYLANHLTEAQMNEVFGWIQSSDMARVYVHLSGRDIDKALLKTYGIQKLDDTAESQFKPKVCDRCKYENSFSNIFCFRCTQPLDEETRIKIIKQESDIKTASNIIDEMLSDQRFREIFLEKLNSMRN